MSSNSTSVGESTDLKERANNLYNTLISEVRSSCYDPYAGTHNPDRDVIRSEAITRVGLDTLRRTTVQGPSITKDKFTSKYWRKWHKEKILLEDISRKEYVSETRAKEQGIEIGVKVKKKGKVKPLPPAIDKATAKPIRSCSFGELTDKRPEKIYFDSHLLGNANSPAKLYEESFHKPVPVNVKDQNAPYDPRNIGSNSNIVGGAMALTNYSKDRDVKSITQRCDYPPMQTSVSDNKGTRFPNATRFNRPPTDGGTIAYADPGARFTGNTSFHFTNEDRVSPNKKDSTPGVGQYNVERLFEGKEYRTVEQFDEIHRKYSDKSVGLVEITRPRLAKIAVFAQGCNRQEHILYGMCLDGMCGRRAKYENAMLLRNDLRRLAGYETVNKIGKNKENISDDIILSEARTNILPDAVYEMDALYAAAYKGDVEVIKTLAKHHANPNVKHKEYGFTPLHVATFKCQLYAVQCLLDSFRGIIRLDIQDKQGDTALHIASRLGYDQIANLICDEESCDPYCCKNRFQEYPIDINKNHKVWQHIKAAIDRNALKKELEELRSRNKQQQSSFS